MTRENLLQAIYDNEDDWSCQYTCPHTMEEENPQDVCMKCAEKQLKEYEDKIRADTIAEISREVRFLYGNEYEKQIRADAIDEFVKAFKDNMLKSTMPTWMCYVEEIAEQLKEQNNE